MIRSRRIVIVGVVVLFISVLAGCATSDPKTKITDRFKVSFARARHVASTPSADSSQHLRVYCEVGILDAYRVLGISRQGVITQFESDKGEIVDVVVQKLPRSTLYRYEGLHYRDGPVVLSRMAKRQPQWVDVLEPFRMTLELESRLLGPECKRINRARGHFYVLMAESIEYVEIPFEPDEDWVHVTPDLEIKILEAESTESACQWHIETRYRGEVSNRPIQFESDLPKRVPIRWQFLRQDGAPGRSFGSSRLPASVGGKGRASGGNIGPVEKIRYAIAVNPSHKKIPFVLEDIPLPDPPKAAVAQEPIPPGAQVGEKAHTPELPDGTNFAAKWAKLSWGAGAGAVSHDVYLGDNFNDVNSGTGDTFRGNQTATEFIIGFRGFPIPGGLVPGTTYYWRIDEVNEADPNSPCRGDIWSFSITPAVAHNPSPADGAESVGPNVKLSWMKGFGAKLHTVYFGDDLDTVTNATGGSPQRSTTFAPSTLTSGTTYYWRVDEFDPPKTFTGEVWSFTVGDATKSDPVSD